MQHDAVTERRHNLGPIPFEADAPFLKIVGELPRDLNGVLYRNGPNPQFDAPGAHWFVGDGMLHAFHLENGRASYRNRWVRTPKWLAEHDAGRALFGGFGRKLPDAPQNLTDGGVANTNIIFHAGKLLALEEAHLPTEIEPGTLATRGYHNYQGRVAGSFTAHPKVDPVTGELVFFGYNAAGPLTPALSYGSIDASGKATRFERFEAPYASMVHDFIVTENHALFPILPITGSMERAMSGRPPYAWEPDKGAYVGVMKRNGTAKDIVWFRGEACYVFHIMNAWEDGNRIIADVMQFEEAPLFPHPDGRPTDPEKSRARHCRWTFDLSGKTDRFQQTYLDDLTGEFPRIDDRRAGLKKPSRLVRLRQSAAADVRRAVGHRPCRRQRQTARSLSAAGRRYHLRAGVRRARDGCSGRRRLAAGGGLARAGEPQRPRRVQRHRCRSRPRRAGAARPPRARRLSRQLGGRAVTLASSFRGATTSRAPE